MISKKLIKLIYFLSLISFPWFNANYFDDIKQPVKIEESAFFEINPCKVSLFEFLYKNNEVKDFEYNIDSYSPIYCFGRISQVKESKQIYIGTNFLVASIYYLFIFTVLLKNNSNLPQAKETVYFTNVLLVSAIFTSITFADRKYYNSILYFLDLESLRTYIIIFLFIILITSILLETYFKNTSNLINLTPYLLLLSGNIPNSNLNIFSIILIYLGIESIKTNFKKLNFFKWYLFISLIWSINSRETFIMENKVYPTLTATSYDMYSTFFYSIFFILFSIGTVEFVFKNFKYFNYKLFISNFTVVLITVLFLRSLNFQNVINFENIYKLVDIKFYNLLINNQKILFLYIFFFLYKFASSKKLTKLNIGIIFLIFINLSYLISSFKEKYDLFLNFLSIYNPTFLELIIGSGPSNFNQFYVEANIQTALTEHSLLASFWLFFGLFGILTLLIIIKNLSKSFTKIFLNKLLIFLVLINLLINDYLYDLSLFLMNLILLNLLNKVDLEKEFVK